MRPLRPLAALIACVAAVAVAGCGGDDDASGVGAALSYVPADTPFAVAIDTDLEGEQYKSLDAILGKFPGADTIKGVLKAQVTKGQEGIDFDRDLKPLLGNPAVISATGVGSFISTSDENGFVAALEVNDTDKLDALIEKTKVKEQGEVAGATVYQDEDTFFGVEDDVVVLAGSRELLDSALERADAGEGLSEEDFEAGLEGLPDEALARLYVDVQGLLSQSDEAAAARKIPWVDALRTLGLTVSAHERSVDIDFNLRTEGDLDDRDLPLAAGDEAAEVVQRPGEIGVGLRDPAQLVTFFESALQAVDPQSFGDYEQGKRALAGRLDLDVDKDLFGQLGANLSVSATIEGEFGVRAEVKDPAAFADTVDKVAEALPDLAGDVSVDRAGDLYEARFSEGATIVFGVVDEVFVLATDAARARAMAGEQPAPVEGAEGALVVRGDAEGIARQVLEQIAPQFRIPAPLVPVFARPLDELKGSIASSPDGLTGKFSLTLD